MMRIYLSVALRHLRQEWMFDQLLSYGTLRWIFDQTPSNFHQIILDFISGQHFENY